MSSLQTKNILLNLVHENIAAIGQIGVKKEIPWHYAKGNVNTPLTSTPIFVKYDF